MLKYLFFVPFFLLPICSSAQVRDIAGLVVCDNQPVSTVAIKNLNFNSQTFSNFKGEFNIQARSGDTLIFIHADFITDTLLASGQQFIYVSLHKRPIVLNEVVIKAAPNSPEVIYEANKKVYKQIYFLGDNSHIFFSGSLVNIDRLNNALGKKGHEARKLQRNLTSDYENSVVDARFNHLAASTTGYTGQQLDDFIINNRPAYDIVMKSSDYDLIQYIKVKLKTVKKK
jgi:hypothetical protein